MLRKILASLLLFTFLWIGTAEAATYYLVATGNYSSTATWSTSTGGSAGAGPPTSSDNVVIDANSGTHTLTIDGTSGSPSNANNVTMTSPSAVTITMGSTAVWDISGNWTAATGITFIPNATSVFNMEGTSSGLTWTSAGYLYQNVNFVGVGGAWTLQDTFTAGGSCKITLTNGTLTTSNNTVGSGSTSCAFSSNNSNTRSIVLGTTTWSVPQNGTAPQWDIGTSTGMTLSAASSTLQFENSANGSVIFNGGGLTYGTLTDTVIGGGTTEITGANSFSALTLTQSSTTSATALYGYFIAANQTVSGACSFNGNSDTARGILAAETIGTPVTISCGSVTATYEDFRDITAAGAASWNFSGLTTTADGDGGGNTGITFTSPKNCYLKAGASSVNFSVGPWETTSGGGTACVPAVPLLQDNCYVDSNSFSATGHGLTINMPRVCGLTFTGVTNTPVLASGTQPVEFYSGLVLVSGMTHTGTGTTYLLGDGSYTLDGGTLTWPTSNLIVVNSRAGSYSLAENFTSNAGLQTNSGTVALNGHNLTITTIAPQGGTISGTGTITGTTYTQTGGTVTLGGTMTLSGANAISAGTLDLNGNNETGETTFALSGSGILNLSGQLLSSSTTTVSGGTINNTGASGEIKSSGANLIAFSGGTSVVKKITQAGASNIVVSGTGNLTLAAGGNINWTSGIFEVSGATAIFNSQGPITGTANTLTSGGGSNSTFGN